MNYDLLIDNLMTHFTAEPYDEEVGKAKSEFFELAGIFDEDESQFEMKMAQFVDWYIFTRKINQHDLSPIEFAVKDTSFSISEELEPFYNNLADNRHSLFEFLKLKGTDLHIRDLFSGYKYVIKKSEMTAGFNKGEYFEARLVPHEDNLVFTKSFCFHPPQASKFILKEIKRINKIPQGSERDFEREAFILKLFKMRYKHEQYQHVDLSEIYSNESRLRI